MGDPAPGSRLRTNGVALARLTRRPPCTVMASAIPSYSVPGHAEHAPKLLDRLQRPVAGTMAETAGPIIVVLGAARPAVLVRVPVVEQGVDDGVDVVRAGGVEQGGENGAGRSVQVDLAALVAERQENAPLAQVHPVGRAVDRQAARDVGLQQTGDGDMDPAVRERAGLRRAREIARQLPAGAAGLRQVGGEQRQHDQNLQDGDERDAALAPPVPGPGGPVTSHGPHDQGFRADPTRILAACRT